MNEFDDLILANGIKLDSNGYLTRESIKIASELAMPHDAIPTIIRRREGITIAVATKQRHVYLCRALSMHLQAMSKTMEDKDKERRRHHPRNDQTAS